MRTLDLVALFVIVCSSFATASAQQAGDKSDADSKQAIRGRTAGQTPSNEPVRKGITSVRAEDIPGSVQIIGRLGQPLGTLLRVRGKWIRPGIGAKDQSLELHVELVDGKAPQAMIVFHRSLITTVAPELKWGRKSKPGDAWDWKFAWHGADPSPEPADGERWEMSGVETGCFNEDTEAWRQIGRVVPPRPVYLSGFVTNFEYIAVRILK
jgi:hypothetical protein